MIASRVDEIVGWAGLADPLKIHAVAHLLELPRVRT